MKIQYISEFMCMLWWKCFLDILSSPLQKLSERKTIFLHFFHMVTKNYLNCLAPRLKIICVLLCVRMISIVTLGFRLILTGTICLVFTSYLYITKKMLSISMDNSICVITEAFMWNWKTLSSCVYGFPGLR